MLTERELCNNYLNPGYTTSLGHLAWYWSAILERTVTVDEVSEALAEMRRRYCRENADECEEDKRRWDKLVEENAASHASGVAFWRSQQL